MLFSSHGSLGILPKLFLVDTEATGIKEEMAQPIVTVCDPSGEWVWSGARVTEIIGAPAYEGVWRKRRADEACGDYRFMAPEMIAVGPMLIPGEASSFAFQWAELLPLDWRTAINETITHDCDPCLRSALRPSVEGRIWGRLRDFLGSDMPLSINHDFVSFDRENILTPEQQASVWDADQVDKLVAPRPKNPVLLTNHPKTGKEYGLFMSIVRTDLTRPWDSTTNPWVLQIVWRPIYKSWWSKVWAWIKRIVSKIINFVKDTFCQLIQNPGVTQSTLNSGNAYAMGATAGSAILAPLICKPKTQTCANGSVIASGTACPMEPPPFIEEHPPGKFPWTTFAIIAAVGIGAGLLLTSRKPA